ncbi:hypothetical protein G3N55_10700 [Dissulfurirhabdus thermomarina]|uniref:HAMP domain-containing histidine kinase n=1 Tax=Dissulfurirhabdus thermomarina TaxID=1765737 RepID=A0A6N9TV50_DISTH|nr:hypothetical protein [Dissulfurirhabdus thermomarina]NDY43307.1 hypothetical protein [Dissulfurirhabdus thermomarina]NMX23506.1 hypothetical protein [Dissulfurirhabdus thermomarina]
MNRPSRADERDFFCQRFQDLLTGRFVKGIVHNMNGPMQILSMQIELFKRDAGQELAAIEALAESEDPAGAIRALVDRAKGRMAKLAQMEESLRRLEDMINVIGKRSQDMEDGVRPSLLNQILQDELLFWQGDLFFKHQVEKEVVLGPDVPAVVAEERAIRNLVDALLACCAELLREAQERKLHLESACDGGCTHLTVRHTGPPFPAGDEAEAEDGDEPPSIPSMAIRLARRWAELAGATLEITPREIRCTFPPAEG